MKDKINEIIEQLTLEEKAQLCQGKDVWNTVNIDRLGIESIMLSDGPHGLRKQAGKAKDHLGLGKSEKATCFPTASAMASSWDRDIARIMGKTYAKECLVQGVSVLLGPGINIKRSPLCGRNFEYYSEDPFLTGEMASNMIKGVQSQGIGTSLKHFAMNNQEKYRMLIDIVADERTQREIYLSAFEKCVKEAKPCNAIMI